MIREGDTAGSVRIRVPGTLVYRDAAMGAVLEACRRTTSGDGAPPALVLHEREFEERVLSAFGEAFNNIALHGGRGGAPPDVDIEIVSDTDGILIQIKDDGQSFDPQRLMEPALPELAESGMGLFIIRSFMDEVDYRPGRPNVLCLRKRRAR